MQLAQVGFNPNVSFKSEAASAAPEKTLEQRLNALEERLDSFQQKADSVINPPKQKKGFKGFLADVAKFWTNATEMAKGIFKGLFYGAVTGAAAIGGAWLFRAKPEGLKMAIKEPMKVVGTKGKAIAALGGLAIAAFHIIKARLRANQRTANVDHQLRTGHRDK